MADNAEARKKELEKIFETSQDITRTCALESKGTGAERMANTAFCVSEKVEPAIRELKKESLA